MLSCSGFRVHWFSSSQQISMYLLTFECLYELLAVLVRRWYPVKRRTVMPTDILYMASLETYNIQPSVTLESRVEVTILTLRKASVNMSPVSVLSRRNHARAIVLDRSRLPIHVLTGLDVAQLGETIICDNSTWCNRNGGPTKGESILRSYSR